MTPPNEPEVGHALDAAPEPTAAEVISRMPSAADIDGERPFTDLEYARRFAEQHHATLRHTRAEGWMAWDGTRWVPDAQEAATRRAWETARRRTAEANAIENADDRQKALKASTQFHNAQRLNAVLQQAKSHPLLMARTDLFNRQHHLLTCSNGTVDLRTGELRPHNREDYSTFTTGHAYDPDAECALFLRVLRYAQPDQEVRHWLQCVAGYAAAGGGSEEIMAIFFGKGQNGKTKLLRAITHAFGEYAIAGPLTLFVGKGSDVPNDLAKTVGRRLVSCEETPEEVELAEAKIKVQTGGSMVSARRLYHEFFDFVPRHLPMLATNSVPKVRGTDDGIWRRLRLVPFSVTVPEEERDLQLEEKLQAEAEGILAWIVRGALAWRRGEGGDDGPKQPTAPGRLPPCAIVDAATKQHRTNNDRIGGFLDEQCEMDPAAFTTSKDLLTAYQAFAMGDGEEPMTSTKLGRHLPNFGLRPHKLNGVRGWLGVRVQLPRDPTDGW